MDKCSFAMTNIKYLGYVIDFEGIYRQLQSDMLSTTEYFLKYTLLYKLGKLFLPIDEHRQKLIWDTHYSKTAGHFGVAKTHVILQKYFY